jgi:hypothetical protein
MELSKEPAGCDLMEAFWTFKRQQRQRENSRP